MYVLQRARARAPHREQGSPALMISEIGEVCTCINVLAKDADDGSSSYIRIQRDARRFIRSDLRFILRQGDWSLCAACAISFYISFFVPECGRLFIGSGRFSEWGLRKEIRTMVLALEEGERMRMGLLGA